MTILRSMDGGGGGSADSSSAMSSAANVFGSQGINENIVALVGVALLAIVALIIVGRSK